jgi:H+-transporting ATPase
VYYKDQPEAWNMRMVLGIATVLGLVGPIAAFGLFFLGDRVYHLNHAHLQTMMYLMLSVAGHLTIFQARTRGPFWSIRPARILWMAVLGTQTAATLIAVYGLFMTPLGWKWAGFVWGYALLWFFVTDPVKLLAYRIFDPVKATTKPDAKAELKTKADAESKPSAKAEPEPEPTAESTPDAKAEADTTPVVESKPEAKEAETKTGTKAETKAKAVAEAKPTVEAKPEAQEIEPKPEVDVETKSETKARTTSDLTPGLVKRVHALYEELGRKDVQAVESMEKADRDNRSDEAKTDAKPEDKAKPEDGA